MCKSMRSRHRTKRALPTPDNLAKDAPDNPGVIEYMRGIAFYPKTDKVLS
jgi:hypothetical protein